MMVDNKFLEITSSPLMNLDHTYRYSGTKLVEPESLSQHIVDTIMMGLKIVDEVNYIAKENLLDPNEYLMKAVCHDLEEVITGDIPRPLKYYNADTTKSMKEVADQVAVRFFRNQFHAHVTYYEYWRDAKEDKEGYILKLVDTLVVVSKVLKEVSMLHNFYMLRVAYEVSQYLQELIDSKYRVFENEKVNDYINSIIHGALSAMNQILVENEDTMHKFSIFEQSMI